MRILGIDPGLNVTGYGVIETSSPGASSMLVVEAGVIRGGRGSLAQRIERIHQGLTDLVSGLAPQVLALEEIYSHYQRPRTAILMAHARGVICLAAAQHGLEVVAYAATQVKRLLTGSGRAGKADVQRAVCRELGLDSVPEPHDVADALAIAMCHAFLQRTVSLPQ